MKVNLLVVSPFPLFNPPHQHLDTASITSDKTTSWRGSLFSKRSTVAKHLGSENGDIEVCFFFFPFLTAALVDNFNSRTPQQRRTGQKSLNSVPTILWVCLPFSENIYLLIY